MSRRRALILRPPMTPIASRHRQGAISILPANCWPRQSRSSCAPAASRAPANRRGARACARSCAAPGALVLHSDVERKLLYATAVHDHLPPEAYRAEVSDSIYRVLTEKAARLARAGHSVIVDAVFAKPQERAAIETAAAAAGADFHGLFLTADLPTRLQRVGGRGPDASDADAEVARKQEEFAIGTLTWPVIDASGSPEQTLNKARAAAQAKLAPTAPAPQRLADVHVRRSARPHWRATTDRRWSASRCPTCGATAKKIQRHLVASRLATETSSRSSHRMP